MTNNFVCDCCGTIDDIFSTPQPGGGWKCHVCLHGTWHGNYPQQQYQGSQDGPMLNRADFSDGTSASFS